MKTVTINPERIPLFPVGTKFIPYGEKHPKECTVTDIYTTRNLAGELIGFRYVSTHKFCGQDVVTFDTVETTIARSLQRSALALATLNK